MSGYHDRGRDDRAYHDRPNYGRGRDDARARPGNRDNDRHRSRSPRRDDSSQQSSSNTHGRYRGSHGDFQRDSGGRSGLDGNLSVSSRSDASSLPSLPASAPFPQGTGEKVPFAKHTARGTVGRQVTVLANHHLIQCLPVIKIYHYDLRFRVPESSQAKATEKITANQMARVLVNTTLVNFLSEHFVFDGVSLGFSPRELMPVGESRSTTISLGKRRDEKPNEVDIEVRNVGPLDIGGFVKYLRAGRIDLNPMGNHNLEIIMKWLSALFRDGPSRTMVSRPNSSAYFQRSRENSMTLASTGGVLEALHGIFQTITLSFSQLHVLVDTTTQPFWTPELTLIQCVCALTRESSPQNLQNNFLSNPDSFFQSCGMLLGCYFNVRHLNANRNAKKVKFLSWSGQDAFSTNFDECVDDGTTRSTSVYDYFQRKYKIKLEYPNLPLAHTRDGDMPLELCFTASDERYRGSLQGAHTADFIKFATCPPKNRYEQLIGHLRTLAWHQNPTIRAHGLSIDPNMMRANALVLDPPELVYGSRTMSPRDGSWNLRGLRFLRPETIKSWALVSFVSHSDGLVNLCHDIQQSFRAVGMSVPRDPPSLLVANPRGDMKVIFSNAIAKAEQDFRSPPELILIVLETNSIPIYHAIKQYLDVVLGIASQVMVAGKVFKGGPQYLANISMKVNVKLCGVNCTVHQQLFRQARWMLIGGDISSASPSALKRDPPPPTTAALCATWDQECTAYTGVATMQLSTASNKIVRAGPMFKELLTRYKEKNGGLLPERIIYYRDGASATEFNSIRDEGQELRRLCQKSGCKITIIVCIKRHHTRFFAECGSGIENVKPGTVVENSSSRNDAFLVAHKAIIGTSRPSHVVSIVDENNLSADEFHKLTYELSYTYARATKSVAVVPPIYYADQMCQRARLHLQDLPNGDQILPQVHEKLKWNMYWQ